MWMMATILKRFCVLSLLCLLCSSECGVFGVENSAESNSLLGNDGIEEDSRENFISRKRRNVYGYEDGSKKGSRELPGKEDDRDNSTDRGDVRSLGVDNEKATEPSGVVEAQVLPNSTSKAPVNSSIAAASVKPSVTEGGTNGYSVVLALLSTPVIVWPTKASSLNGKVTPQSATVGQQATSSAPIPTRTRFVSTVQSTRITATHRTPTSDVDATTGDDGGGNVQGRGDTPDKKRKTLFGFVTVEILIALLAGAACAVILVAFLVYRIKKRNEGSYELCEMVNYTDKSYTGKDSEKEVFV